MKKILLVASLLFGINAQANTFQITESQVEFLAIGKPSALKIRGKGQGLKSELQWKDQQLAGRFKFNLNSLGTGIELRDKHMKEKYLETTLFPEVELLLGPISLSPGLCKEAVQMDKIPFEGTLRLHGVEKKLAGHFDIKSEKERGKALVRFELNLTDYQIEIPVYLGIKIADRVENVVSLEWVCVQ